MLTLLRKVRKKLVNQNKLSSYLLYAVGEIFLVVIGIVIAIQLNNWNTSRKADKEDKALMVNLINDLAQDTTRLALIANSDVNNLSLKTASGNCLGALALSYQKMDVKLADSLLAIPLSAGRPLINTETSVYEQLKETGRLYTLGSDSLRRKIIKYYRDATKESVYNVNRNNRHREAQEKLDFCRTLFLNKKFDPGFNMTDAKWIFNPSSSEMETFRLSVSTMYETQHNNYRKWVRLNKQAKGLIQAINLEI